MTLFLNAPATDLVILFSVMISCFCAASSASSSLALFLTSRSRSEYVVCSFFFKRCDLSSCVSFNFPRLSIVFHVSSVIQYFLFTSHNAWFKLSILIILEDTEAVPQFNFKGFHYITVPQPSYIKHFFGFRSFKHVIAPHNSSKTNFSITE